MEPTSDRQSEVTKWLTVVLAEENVIHFSINITGSSEKGDGYVGDIIFVVATGTDKQGKKKEYHFVLKCSKSSAALMEKVPAFRKAFIREAYLYEHVFPLFKQFQVSKGVEKPFDSVPKCYGVYQDEYRYVIVLEDLKKVGYDLWPKKKPLTRKVINTVTRNYAKFHATSVALQEQNKEQFVQLLAGMKEDVFRSFFETSDFIPSFKSALEEVYEILRGDVENDILERWLTLREEVSYIFREMDPDREDLQVISHGDCWVNNFLYKFENEDKTDVSKVAILDWQISKFTSPVIDLSYFLFAGISSEDIADMNTILKNYYENFCEDLASMGSHFANTYTLEKFLNEWKKFSKFGVVMCILPTKSLYAEKEDLPDMAEAADSEKDISESFKFEIRDKVGFKERMKPIVEYFVKNVL